MDFSPVWISLKTAGLSTVIVFLLGVVIAHWRISSRKHLLGLIDGLFILPIALPPTVVGLLLLLLLGKSSPIGNIVNIVFTWTAALIASIVVSFPLMYLTARAAFKQIDSSLIDLARVYGYSEQRILWQIMIPLAWHGLAAGTVLCFVRSLGEFGATLMLAGNIPGTTQTMPIAIFFNVEAGDMNQALILSIINIAISITAIFISNSLEKN